eukprot:TRINITY_DN17016_c0_g1_i1.p1 TRINITY_DN17016_c0_g1~~TRINITY_DN17016_c0_g1_i1.p1  ORF type:complete len:1264 (-),score=307.06 TRINITY_DN17016_c0_g1_i1:30-3821(-)
MGGKSSTSRYQKPGAAEEAVPTAASRAWEEEGMHETQASKTGLRTSARSDAVQQQPAVSSTAPAPKVTPAGGGIGSFEELTKPDDEVERSFKADMHSARPRKQNREPSPAGSRKKGQSQRQAEPALVTNAFEAKGANQLSVPKDAKVLIVEHNGNWSWCKYGEHAGWVPAKYLSTSTQESTVARTDGSEASKTEHKSDGQAATTSMPVLPEPWTRRLANSMILHTVQNAMILASYLLDLLTGGYGTRSALHIACWEGSPEAVQAVTNGSKKTVLDWHKRKGDLTPLHIASICGHATVVNYLLELDVDPNISTVHALRPLHIASSSSPDLVEILLAGRADATACTADRDTPLHFATCYQQIDTIEFLLNDGADPAAENNFGVTPLHVAGAYAALESLRLKDSRAALLLCARGADPQARDHHGNSPADVVRMAGGAEEIIEFLESSSTQQRAQDLLSGQHEDEEQLGDILADVPPKVRTPRDQRERSGSTASASGASQGGPSQQLGSQRGRSLERSCSSDMKLAEENARLARDLARTQKELDELRANVKHLEGLLDQSRSTLAQVNSAAVRSQTASASQNSEAFEAVRGDMEKEIDELRHREQNLGSERESWLKARDALQGQLRDAEAKVASLVAERDAALQEASQLQAARPKTPPAPSRPSSALQRQADELNERAEELSQKNAALSQKDAELEARAKAEEEARAALGTKDEELARVASELEQLRAESERRGAEAQAKAAELAAQKETELNSIRAEMQRLGEDLQRQAREKEETWKSLTELRAEHKELREKQAAQLKEHQNAQATFQEREVMLEGKIKEQELMVQKLEADVAELTTQVDELNGAKERAEQAEKLLEPWKKRTDELHEAFQKEQTMRKRYHNQMQDMKGAIRVFARIRPRVAREQDQEVAVWRRDAFSLETESKDKKGPKDYNFDAVFDERHSQEDVFADCRGLIGSAVDGFNVTVFAYGQTGAGKTHTMYGNDAMPGLVPRAAHELFQVIGRYAHDCESRVLCSMFELYRDDLVDLLATKVKGKTPPSLDIKKDSRGTVKVENAVEVEVNSPEELLRTIARGNDKRHVAATKMNADSSRSHSIFIVMIENTNHKTKQVSTGKLTLCDLAGSERLKKSEVTGEQLKEAQSINKSLTALGDVIEALTKQAKHVPYRNHRLTQLLSDSLGGNAKTLMFVNCSPALGNLDETGAALSYAVRAKNIMNKVEKNSDSQEVARLKKVIQVMSSELEQARATAGTGALPQLGEEEADEAPEEG